MTLLVLLSLTLAAPAPQDGDTERSHLRQALELLAEQSPTAERQAALLEVHERAWRLGDEETARAAVDRFLADLEEGLAADPTTLAHELNQLGVRLSAVGDHDGALAFFERSLPLSEEVLGPDHPQVAVVLVNMATLVVASAESSSDEWVAEPWLEQALAILEGVAPGGSDTLEFSRATALAQLSLFALRRGDMRRARDLAATFLELYDPLPEFVGPVLPWNALSTHSMASRVLGDFETARAGFERLLSIDASDGAMRTLLALTLLDLGETEQAKEHIAIIRETDLAEIESAEVAVTAMLLGQFLFMSGEQEDGRELLEQVVSFFMDRQLPPDDVALAGYALVALGQVTHELGEYERARSLLEEGIERTVEARGPDQPNLGLAYTYLARNLHVAGELDAAREALRKGIAIVEDRLGADNVMMAPLLATEGDLLEDEGRLDEALATLQRSLSISNSTFGTNNQATARRIHGLASLLATQGRLFAARRECERALAMRREAFGEDHPDTARSLHLLGEIVRRGGEPDEARTLLEQALPVLSRSLGDEHPDTASCAESLASLLEEQGELEPAAQLYRRVVDGRLATFGERHVDTVAARSRLAHVEQALGTSGGEDETRLRAARGLYEEVLAVQEADLPDDHEALQDTRRRLADTLDALGLDAEASRVRGAVREAVAYPPLVRVLRPEESLVRTEERRYELDAVVTDYSGVRDVEISQDGVVASAAATPGALVPDETGRTATLRYSLRVHPPATETRATLKAVGHGGLESEPTAFVVRYAPPQRDLYVLALGVADYDDDALDLAYPVADVDGLIERLSGERGRLYEEVHVERVTDADVTGANLRRLRSDFLRRAKPEDTIVVFAAGHGVRTEDGDYYFLTSDSTVDDPYAGIDRETLESLVTWRRLHAARRVLLLDTCHAGAPFGETVRAGERGARLYDQREIDDAVDLTAEGLYIIAASADDGFARERSGNGLFTRALLEGLGGAADKDDNGYVEIEELKDYAAEVVHAESGGRQRPTVPTVRGGENFPLVKVSDG